MVTDYAGKAGRMWWKSVVWPIVKELGKAFLMGGALALGHQLVDKGESPKKASTGASKAASKRKPAT
jgi:hypothetical protein